MPKASLKKKSDPNNFLVFLYGAMMAASGVFLGILYLMSFPLVAYSSLGERERAMEERESMVPVPGDAFYIEGPVLRSRGWESKREALLEAQSGSVTVTVGEINAWLEDNFRVSAQSGEASDGLTILPNTPNLGMSESGEIYLNLPCKITGYGLDGEYVLSARVTYAGSQPTGLQVHQFQLGGAAIPLPSVLGAKLIRSVMGAYSGSEEYASMNDFWSRLASVEVSEGALVFTL